MRELAVSSILLTGIRSLGIILQALVILFLARILPIEDMGWFAMIYALLGVIRSLGPFGTDQIALRRISAKAGEGISAEIQRLCNTTTALAMLVGVAGALAVAILVASYEGAQFPSGEIALSCLAIPAFSVMGVLAAQIRGVGHNFAAQVPESIGVHLFFGGFVALLAFSHRVELATVILGLNLAGWAVVALYQAILLRIGVAWPRIPRWFDIGRLVKEGSPIFQALAANALALRAPVFLAGALIGPAAVALIEIASRFGNVPSITTSSVALTFSPHYARSMHSRDRKDLMKSLWLSAILATAPAFGWLLILAFGAPYMINTLLPPVYADSYGLMLLVALASTINAACGLSSNLLLMTGATGTVRWFSLAQLLAICAGSMLLAPRIGIIGIGWAMVIASIVRDGGMFAFVLLRR